MKVLEICCYGAESAALAAKHGADRIELCAGRSEGGLTPSYGDLKLSLGLGLPVFPMLRPRGGDFCYTDTELAVMKEDLIMIRDMGFKGIVFGILTTDGLINMPAMQQLMSLAGNMEVTFHRAFDAARDPFESLKQLSELGVARILTSGMKGTAEEGLELIKELSSVSNGPVIMAGSGVRPGNILKFKNAGIEEVHSSAGVNFPSPMTYKNPDIYMGHNGQDEYIRFGADINAIAEMKRLINAS